MVVSILINEKWEGKYHESNKEGELVLLFIIELLW